MPAHTPASPSPTGKASTYASGKRTTNQFTIVATSGKRVSPAPRSAPPSVKITACAGWATPTIASAPTPASTTPLVVREDPEQRLWQDHERDPGECRPEDRHPHGGPTQACGAPRIAHPECLTDESACRSREADARQERAALDLVHDLVGGRGVRPEPEREARERKDSDAG